MTLLILIVVGILGVATFAWCVKRCIRRKAPPPMAASSRAHASQPMPQEMPEQTIQPSSQEPPTAPPFSTPL